MVLIIVDCILMLSGFYKNEVYKSGERVSVSGCVNTVKTNEYGLGCYLDEGIYVTIQKNIPDISVGDTILVDGVVKELQLPRNDGQFNQKQYYRSIGIFYKISASKVSVISHGSSYDKLINRVKATMTDSFSSIMSDNDAAVMSAVVLGDKSDMDKDYYELYQQSGIAHLLAISGLHVSFVGMALYQILRKSGFTCLPAFGAALCFLAAYGVLTGNGVSARRAVIMCVVRMGAEVVGRYYDTLSSLSLAAILLIAENPYVIVNSGFLLSFLAILGICVMVPPVTGLIKPAMDNWCDSVYFDASALAVNARKAVRWFVMSLATSAAISLFTLPVILYSFFEVPVMGVLLNVFVIPLMSLVLFTGITGGVAACVSRAAGTFLIGGAHYVLQFYEMLCRLTGELSFNRLCLGRPSMLRIVIYYVCLVGGIYLLSFLKERKLCGRAGVLVYLVTIAVVAGYRRNDGFVVHMIDVGQGDGIYVQCDSLNMLFDGGSTDISSVGKYRIYPFLRSHGVSCIDYVFVSHTDNDHINGIAELMDMTDASFKIGTLVMPRVDEKIADDNYAALIAAANDKNVRIVYAAAGTFAIEKGKLAVSCVSPYTDEKYADVNSASAVYLLEYDAFDMLMTGDMTKESEEILLKRQSEQERSVRNISKINVLKTAHHGSKTSSSTSFIGEVSPDVALISCGIDNRYNHPSPETLDTLEAAGCEVYETDVNGQISIFYKNGTYTVKTKF